MNSYACDTFSRFRRLRSSAELRSLVAETSLSVSDLIQPLFVVEGEAVENPIASLPGQYQRSVDRAVSYAHSLFDLGIKAVLLFGVLSKEQKDDYGSIALRGDGVVQEAIRALKREIPGLIVISDLCFCEYTSHGHCGVVEQGEVANDKTLSLLAELACSHAQAGVDMVAPSGMMDGMVRAIRGSLDDVGFHSLPIMSYSAKFASSLYGPFRDAAACAPSEGDRNGYQMNPANSDEALREAKSDIEEGADILMVKPAGMYLDIVRRIKDTYNIPLAAYQVSGEYSMIKAAAKNGWFDEQAVIAESLLSIRRAGADIIITYFAEAFAKALR